MLLCGSSHSPQGVIQVSPTCLIAAHMGIRSCTAMRHEVHLCCWMMGTVLSCLWTSVFWGGRTSELIGFHLSRILLCVCLSMADYPRHRTLFRTHFPCSVVSLSAFMVLHSFRWTCTLMSFWRDFCVHVFGLHICLCIMCMQCFLSLEEAIGSTELELHIVVSCSAEPNLDPLQDQPQLQSLRSFLLDQCS